MIPFPSPPRRILLIVGADIGDDFETHWLVSLLISGVLALVCAAIWVASQHACCDVAKQRRLELARRQGLSGRRASSAGGVPLDELWTIHNKRYDVRRFVNSHPGGASAIALGQGRNCTELYESYHSLANEKLVAATLARFFVEDAPPGAPDYEDRFEWRKTPVFDSVKARVRAHFAARRVGHRATAAQWAQLLVFVAASALALRSFMRGELRGLLALPFCYWWGPSPCMHDGGHFSLSRRPWLNTLCAHIGGAHMSLFSWQHQHTVGHHVHTNIPGHDPDLYHFECGADGGLPGFRTSLEGRTLPERTCGMTREKWWR